MKSEVAVKKCEKKRLAAIHSFLPLLSSNGRPHSALKTIFTA